MKSPRKNTFSLRTRVFPRGFHRKPAGPTCKEEDEEEDEDEYEDRDEDEEEEEEEDKELQKPSSLHFEQSTRIHKASQMP